MIRAPPRATAALLALPDVDQAIPADVPERLQRPTARRHDAIGLEPELNRRGGAGGRVVTRTRSGSFARATRPTGRPFRPRSCRATAPAPGSNATPTASSDLAPPMEQQLQATEPAAAGTASARPPSRSTGRSISASSRRSANRAGCGDRTSWWAEDAVAELPPGVVPKCGRSEELDHPVRHRADVEVVDDPPAAASGPAASSNSTIPPLRYVTIGWPMPRAPGRPADTGPRATSGRTRRPWRTTASGSGFTPTKCTWCASGTLDVGPQPLHVDARRGRRRPTRSGRAPGCGAGPRWPAGRTGRDPCASRSCPRPSPSPRRWGSAPCRRDVGTPGGTARPRAVRHPAPRTG